MNAKSREKDKKKPLQFLLLVSTRPRDSKYIEIDKKKKRNFWKKRWGNSLKF